MVIIGKKYFLKKRGGGIGSGLIFMLNIDRECKILTAVAVEF